MGYKESSHIAGDTITVPAHSAELLHQVCTGITAPAVFVGYPSTLLLEQLNWNPVIIVKLLQFMWVSDESIGIQFSNELQYCTFEKIGHQDYFHDNHQVDIPVRVYTIVWKAIHTKLNKSDGKRQNTLGCLDQYTCNMLDCETVGIVKQSRYISVRRGWRPWNSQDCEAV